MNYPQDHYQGECPFKEEWATQKDLQRYSERPWPVKYNIDWEALYTKWVAEKLTYRELAKSTGTKVSTSQVGNQINRIKRARS